MRNFIFVILLVISLNNTLKSQPTLNSGNFNPHIGLQYTFIGVDYFTPPDPTGLFNWDFSSVVTRDTFTLKYYGHGGLPEDSLFPSSNIARKIKSKVDFLATSLKGISIVGYNDSLTYKYSDYIDMIRYPFTFNSQYTDYDTAEFVRNNETIKRIGSVLVRAPAYGNIKLPFATINNVLEVKIIEAYNDFAKTGNEYHEITTYSWYVPGVSDPIISFRSENYKSKITQSGYYISQESLGFKGNSNELYDIVVISHIGKKMPDMFQINIPNQMTVKIRCVNSEGKEMFEKINSKLTKGQNTVELGEHNILPGVYLMIIYLDDHQIVKKFIIQE